MFGTFIDVVKMGKCAKWEIENRSFLPRLVGLLFLWILLRKNRLMAICANVPGAIKIHHLMIYDSRIPCTAH